MNAKVEERAELVRALSETFDNPEIRYVTFELNGDHWNMRRFARIPENAANPFASRPPLSGDVEGQQLLASVKEQVEEASHDDSGRWLTCSGCYEGSDGYNVHGYPYSEAFGCVLGGGCMECGGIGARWDTTDYDAMARDMLANDEALATPSAGEEHSEFCSGQVGPVADCPVCAPGIGEEMVEAALNSLSPAWFATDYNHLQAQIAVRAALTAALSVKGV